MYDSKYTQKLLQELLKQGGKIIRKGPESVSETEKLKIINIFSILMNERYDNIRNFEKMIEKTRKKKQINTEKIVQLLYDFIFSSHSDPSIDCNSQVENINESIKKIKKSSKIFEIKNHLSKKVNELGCILNEIQKQELVTLEDNIKKINSIGNNDIDVNGAIKSLEVIDENLSINVINADVGEKKNLFENIKEKLNEIFKIINENSEMFDKNKLNEIIKKIDSKIKLILSQTDEENSVTVMKECHKTCKQIRDLSHDSEKQLLSSVKKYDDKAFSLKAFKNFYNNHSRIIQMAKNSLEITKTLATEVNNKEFENANISDECLSKYRDIVDNKDVRIFNKKFFDNSVNEIKKIVKNELKKITKKSMFGNSTPPNNKIFNKLSGVICDSIHNRKDKKTAKDVLKEVKDELQNCTPQYIQNFLVEKNIWNDTMKNSVWKIFIHRDISNLNYVHLLNTVLDNNGNNWKTLTKKVYIRGGKNIEAEITSTPACEMGIFTHLEKGQGVNSNERNSEHAINLWKTEVKGSEGKILFSALRHGNTRGKDQSTKEIILAAAYQQYGETLLTKNSSKENPIKVKLGNIQLMSPTRGLTSSLSPDKKLPFKQVDKFKEYINKPFEMKINAEKSIWLKLEKPILVNFGTNVQYYALHGALVTSSTKQNQEAFNTLFGKSLMKSYLKNFYKNKKNKLSSSDFKNDGQIGEWILNNENKKRDDYDIKLKEIINLSNQILSLWYSTNKRGKSSNPAAIQTRLAALMYLIGYPVSFNCKSGKDRTGEVAAEINNLVLNMEANDGEVPDPNKKLTADDKLQLRRVLDSTQSDKIAETNTEFRGLKIKYKNTEKIFGGSLKGASRNAKV